jgi:hypothetical protein
MCRHQRQRWLRSGCFSNLQQSEAPAFVFGATMFEITFDALIVFPVPSIKRAPLFP